jgi:hypothetical protein
MPFMPSEKESGALRDIFFHIDAAERFAHGHTFESLHPRYEEQKVFLPLPR